MALLQCHSRPGWHHEHLAGAGWIVRTITVATQAVAPWSVAGTMARWAPVGDLIAVMPDVSAGGTRIGVVHTDGTGYRAVSPAGAVHGTILQGFDWSPDGRWLVVRADTQLQLINVTTGLVLPLAWSGLIVQPAWRPAH
jgi:hypothetical protein